MERLVYTSSSGESISLEGQLVWSGIAEDLRSHKWEYTMRKNMAYGMHPSSEERDLDYTAPYESANALRKLADADIVKGKPGIIRIDAYKQRCFIVANQIESVHGGRVFARMTLLLIDGFWHIEKTKTFYKIATNKVGIDYDYDYDYDYGFSSGISFIENGSPLPAPARITFFGIAHNPSIRIGTNEYKVLVDVAYSNKVVLDFLTEKPSVTLFNNLGFGTNVFQSAVRDGGEDGGTYAFKYLEPGLSEVSYDGTFDVFVEWHERETEPPWTL